MSTPEHTITAYFAAMRRGPEAEHDLLDLFADDAVYREPFIQPGEPAVGLAAIRARLRSGWSRPLPDLELDVLSVTVDGQGATSTWECRSSAFPAPVRGTDRYRFRDGKIVELDVTIDQRSVDP
ncbi:MAG: nuclear transport factor 2 family protein [Actinomycetota bacterium]